MLVEATPLSGVMKVTAQPAHDERGYFARLWSAAALAELGLDASLDEHNVSHNVRRGTVRGMHWQARPHAETKLVRCSRGAVFDVVVDVREGSATQYDWWGTELQSDGLVGLWIPEGFAHGYVTLEDNSDVSYLMTGRYQPSAALGLRWDDPRLGIDWPEPVQVVSARDAAYPLLPQ